jgi:transposase-like protein
MFKTIDPESIKKTDVQDLQGKIVDIKEIKKIFSCDRNTIYNWRRKGLLRMARIGGKLYASRQDIEKLIKRVTG